MSRCSGRWRPSPPLGSRSRPGHCPCCGRPLGRADRADPTEGDALTEEELAAHAWVEHAIGDLIAAAPSLLRPPSRAQIVRALDASVDRVAGGSRRAWARRLGLTMETVASWEWGRTIPSLGLLLRVCSRLGTTPRRFLAGDGDPDPPTGGGPVLPEGPASAWWIRPEAHREAMRLALDAVLAADEQPPPSLRAVARRLGETTTYLHRYVPDLCRAISDRHRGDQIAQGIRTRERLREEIRQAARRVHADGCYPSAYRIAPLLSKAGSIRSKPARAAWRDALRELGWQT